MRLAIFVLLAVTLFNDGPSCSSNHNNSNDPAKPQEQSLAIGTWGGQHVQAQVSDRGVELEFDCAQGKVPQKILLDSSGRFDVDGSFMTEHAGPVREEENNGRPVRFRGSVSDKQMELTVFDPKTKETIGTFTLKFGNEGRLMKCR
jgi:hypothetical protein